MHCTSRQLLYSSDLVHSAVDVWQSSDDVVNFTDDAVILSYEGSYIEHKLTHSFPSCVQKHTNAVNCKKNKKNNKQTDRQTQAYHDLIWQLSLHLLSAESSASDASCMLLCVCSMESATSPKSSSISLIISSVSSVLFSASWAIRNSSFASSSRPCTSDCNIIILWELWVAVCTCSLSQWAGLVACKLHFIL